MMPNTETKDFTLTKLFEKFIITFCLFKCRRLWKGDMMIARQLNFHFPLEKPKKTVKIIWRKPQLGWYKLNTDGAAKGGMGQAGVGGIIRDHLGNAILAFYDFIGTKNSTFAETFALTKGLQLAQEHGISKL
ncbi:hypothetical protein Pfo_030964 [Paulownia fortunei]|nr:hypothetical protein Pfo_030964 [Paulownia fortunei]